MLQSVFGILVFILLSWLVSEQRDKFPVRVVLAGVGLQFVLGLLLLKIPVFTSALSGINQLVLALEKATSAGTSMVFGYLGGAPLPFAEPYPGAAFVLAFKALPIVLVLSALSALLFYWRILPLVISAFAKLFEKTLKVGGAEGLGLAANIFVGMVESPLLIRPYIKSLSRSELFSILCCGMATVAGTVIVLYASILNPVLPGSLSHILVASVMSVPAAFVIARIMIPGSTVTKAESLEIDKKINSSMAAIVEGTHQGIRLLVYIVAMLIIMVALIELVNLLLGFIPINLDSPLTLQMVLGYLFAPVVWLIGIPWQDALVAGSLLGTKSVINEFVAYLNLASLPAGSLSPLSMTIMTYALCGFANPGSLGIMIGGLTSMAPERQNEIIQLGLKSLLAGTLATCMTGAVVNIILQI